MQSKKMQGLVVAVLFLLHCLSQSQASPRSQSDESSRDDTIYLLERQLMLQQLFTEERIRSEGQSGLKRVRHVTDGTRPYHYEGHAAPNKLGSMHNHWNYHRTVGMGEFIAVLNGVEFRTRHNDYGLYMPDVNDPDLHAVDEIPLPEVPPEVLRQPTVEDQILEMREWFKAWKDQDFSVRDYRPYFKPVLCYLEGAWMMSSEKIDEPFFSQRHAVEASSWFDLQEKIRFTSYTGSKNVRENFSFLPTTIVDIVNGTVPVLAQWNYRILCHPIQRELPTSRFRAVDDLAVRMRNKMTYEQLIGSREARFQLNPRDTDTWRDEPSVYNLMDQIMAEIPGKDNYQGQLYDDAFGADAYEYGTNEFQSAKNVAYYHRMYKTDTRDAMGVQARHRGFSDDSLYMAMTSHEEVAGMGVEICKGRGSRKKCSTWRQRWSYAIPLEIIYMTPLQTWNPMDIEYKGHHKTILGKTVKANGRNGGFTEDTAFDGINLKNYRVTPAEFYGDEEPDVIVDFADTPKNVTAGVLNREGRLCYTLPSGIRVMLPEIPGVGVLRQRYPVMPIHGEGGTVWKELEALKDIVLNPQSHGHLYRERP